MKYTSHFRRALVPLLAGCATPAVIDTASLPAKPAAFREASTTTAPALQGTWWCVFAAPVLSQLVGLKPPTQNPAALDIAINPGAT